MTAEQTSEFLPPCASASGECPDGYLQGGSSQEQRSWNERTKGLCAADHVLLSSYVDAKDLAGFCSLAFSYGLANGGGNAAILDAMSERVAAREAPPTRETTQRVSTSLFGGRGRQ